MSTNGKKKGWQTGKNRNHLCGTPSEVIELFGLFWVKAEAIDTTGQDPRSLEVYPPYWTKSPGRSQSELQ